MNLLSPGKKTYLGMFFLALAAMVYEVLLTRIFSVTMWYHFAFAAVSIAMLGLVAGAVAVYFFQERAARHSAPALLAVFTQLCALAMTASFFAYTRFQFGGRPPFYFLAFVYATLSLPFFFAGIATALALSRFSSVGKIYAADLAGAALGCVVFIWIINVTDGVTAVIFCSFLAALAACFFSQGRKSVFVSLFLAAVFAFSFAAHHYLSVNGKPFLRLAWIKGGPARAQIYEKWNALSRITVHEAPAGTPMGWGLSRNVPAGVTAEYLDLKLDAGATTLMTRFDGNLDALEYLKYDVTNVVHFIRPGSDVAIIGAGGGRDVLSALKFGQKRITAIEINPDILRLLNGRYGDFTGHLDRYPNVRFVRDEARSYLRREPGAFDIIHISLIDTWAASMVGAYALSEHSLYTTEAWRLFINKLTPRGVMSVSRWYAGETPAEIFRLTALANQSLLDSGVKNPVDHLVLIRSDNGEKRDIGTLLISKEPFSGEDLSELRRVAESMGYKIVFTREGGEDKRLFQLAAARSTADYPSLPQVHLTAPTDDSPFFFRFASLRKQLGDLRKGIFFQSSSLLLNLLATVTILSIVFVILPVFLKKGPLSFSGHASVMTYFGGIGLGFMLIEISQMQRVVIFLGYPSIAIATALCGLLLGSGAGSYWADRMPAARLKPFAALLAALCLFPFAFSWVVRAFESVSAIPRIGIVAAAFFSLGLFLGMPFTLGIKLLRSKTDSVTPLAWAVNGGASVCASVLAVAISSHWGISAAFWTGTVCYLISSLVFIVMARRYAP